jgi:PAT family beta-lactamase induction signal transducer AmpG
MGKTLKGFSGTLVEGLQHSRSLLSAYAEFYVISAAIGLPAILLCLMLATRPTARLTRS